jgi:transcriptional regulator with XRE-family HTH domain
MELEQIKKELGLKIKAYRAYKNLTQEQFCELTEIEQANLSNIENGKTYPGFTTLCTLIEKGNIKPDYLFDFLHTDSQKLKLSDYEIIDLISQLPENIKVHFKCILEEILK